MCEGMYVGGIIESYIKCNLNTLNKVNVATRVVC